MAYFSHNCLKFSGKELEGQLFISLILYWALFCDMDFKLEGVE